MAQILLYFLIFIGTNQWRVSAENPLKQEHEVDTSKDATSYHGSNIFKGDVEYSLFKELENTFSNKADTMATLKENVNSSRQIDSKKRRRIEALINGQQFEVGAMRDDSSGPSCTTCFGNDIASCAKNSKTVKCASGKQCYTVHLTTKSTGEKSVIKGCLETARCQSNLCEKIINSSNGQYSFCDTKCCGKELCNYESVPLPTPRPLPAVPSSPRCRHCQGVDEASCQARTTIKQCDSDHRCAAVYVVQKLDGKGILAKGCIKNSMCDSGLCKALTQSGKYGLCKGSCCVGNLCTKNVDTKLPTTTTTPVSTEPAKPKCFACNGRSQQECDQRAIVKECEIGQKCFTAKAVGKSTGKTSFIRDCSKPDDCQTYCTKFKDLVSHCFYNCCSGSLCNTPKGFSTHAPTTHRPVTQRPGSLPMMCYHCNSQVSEEDCEATRILRQCSGSDRICYTGRATYVTGKTIIAKGCMQPEQCHSTCQTLGKDIKYCNVSCCRQNSCNAMKVLPTTPTPHTVKPTIKNPSLRVLVDLIQAFKILLGAIETSVRVSADFNAADYRPQIKSLMNQIDRSQPIVAEPIRISPAVKKAKRQMRKLRSRAKFVLAKIEEKKRKTSPTSQTSKTSAEP